MKRNKKFPIKCKNCDHSKPIKVNKIKLLNCTRGGGTFSINSAFVECKHFEPKKI